MKKIILALSAITTLFLSCAFPLSANAAPGDSIALYLSAPLVQGSSVSGAGSNTETFDTANIGTCPSSTQVGTITTSPSSAACYVANAQTYGGASSSSSSPSFGGSGTRFAATPYPANGGTITFSFPTAVKYVGFWWSAGNNGNQVEFLNGGTVVASYDSAQLMTLLGSTVPSPYPGVATVTSLGGDSYLKGRYFGNPRGFTSLVPTSQSSVDGSVVFAYLNLYLGGTISVDAVRFSGDGFEFDNITTSTVAQTPAGTSVFASSVLGKSVQFLANGSGVTGTMPAQTETSSANLNTLAFSRPGYTFTGWNTQANNGGTAYGNLASYSFATDLTLYAQWSANSYQISYDSQGGSTASAGTYSTGGSVTLATAPTRAGYTFNGWFTASSGGQALTSPYSPAGNGNLTLYAQWSALPSQSLTWSPSNTTSSSMPTTPNVAATTTGDGSISYSVVSGGTSDCSVNASTGVITYSVSGFCTVRAAAAATTNFSSAYVDRVFTLTAPATQAAAGLATTGSDLRMTLFAGIGAIILGLIALACGLRPRQSRT